MKMLGKKGILTTLLLAAMLVASVSAWTVLSGATGAGARGTVEQAEATVDNAGWIELGSIGSGYSFSASETGNVTVTNAKELDFTFSVSGLGSGEKAVMVSGTLTIVEPGVAVLGTIDLTATTLGNVTATLADGTHTIRYDVAGVAGYPSADKYVEFLVDVAAETP